MAYETQYFVYIQKKVRVDLTQRAVCHRLHLVLVLAGEFTPTALLLVYTRVIIAFKLM